MTEMATVAAPTAAARATTPLQRKCACGTHTFGTGECSACAQRRKQNGAAATGVQGSTRSAAQTLAPIFGHDLSSIRVHANAPLTRGRAAAGSPDGGPAATTQGAPIDAVPQADEASPSTQGHPYACVVAEEIPVNLSPLINRQGQIRRTFDMRVAWRDDPQARGTASSYCDCRCGEYRQYVKGHLIVNGRPETLHLWGGAVLEDNVWHEDGLDGDPVPRYGHRDEARHCNDDFPPNRATGCSYEGHDAPGVFFGSDIDVLFKFKGQTYDRCNDVFGAIHEWELRFVGQLNYGP